MGLINSLVDKVVETEDKHKPLSVFYGSLFRMGTLFSVLLVSIIILFANLNVDTYSIEDNIKHILKAFVFSILHVFYLYVVLSMQILKKPVENLYYQQFIIPVLLILAYAFYAFQIYSHMAINFTFNELENLFKTLSLTFFCSLYILWFIRDIKKNKGPDKIWIGLDIISIVLLLITIFTNKRGFWFSQNAPIFICLGVWVFFKLFEFLQYEKVYKNSYDEYLLYNRVIPSDNKININIENELSIFDFGCGNGSRLIENLNLIKNIESHNISITGYDILENFKGKFIENINNHISCKSAPRFYFDNIPNINKFNLIFLSHVLYDHSALSKSIDVLKKCKKNTLIIIRGVGPNSFFTTASFSSSNMLINNPKKKNISYLWYSKWLLDIEKECNLTRLNETKKPDLIIKQEYDISTTNSIEVISDLLIKLYNNGGLTNRIKDYFVFLNTYQGVDKVPNNDLLYIYKKL